MIIVKIGGGKAINLAGVVRDLAGVKDPFIIVHGANAIRDAIAAKMGYPTKTVTSVSGYASVLSDENAIDAIMMGYAGIQNKRLVELCQQHGVKPDVRRRGDPRRAAARPWRPRRALS